MEHKDPSKKRRYIILIIVFIAFLLLSASAFYYYNQYTMLKSNPSALSESQTKELMTDVGKLMSLPSDETPQVATVVNPNLVQEHTPFTQTQTGDIILIYKGIKRAILYRPSQHRIIDVAAVIIGTASPTTMPQPSAIINTTPTLTASSTAKPKLRVVNP